MFLFALLATSAAHHPTPDDIHRFGFEVRPLAQSVPRVVWNTARSHVYELRQPLSEYVIYGREHAYNELVTTAMWRERVWDAVDDMARECCSWEGRMSAAQRLREKIGAVAYWLGELPAVGD